jgi:rod shape-determining protein MreD
MSILPSILILLVTLLTVFAQAALPGFRPWFGAQVDLLPALMIYTALTSNIVMVAAVAVVGGLALDSLSANALGASLLPLFVVGLIIHSRRDLILRDQMFAQFVLGGFASAIVPSATLLLLLSAGDKPLIGWGTLWQLSVMIIGGAVATPLLFWLFEFLNRCLGYQPVTESSFRPDREIRRGRN